MVYMAATLQGISKMTNPEDLYSHLIDMDRRSEISCQMPQCTRVLPRMPSRYGIFSPARRGCFSGCQVRHFTCFRAGKETIAWKTIEGMLVLVITLT